MTPQINPVRETYLRAAAQHRRIAEMLPYQSSAALDHRRRAAQLNLKAETL